MRRSSVFTTPNSLTSAQAGGFFIAFQTAWFGLCRRANLRAGETVLVHAAAGGVGSAAVQLAKALGASVIAVVGGAEKARIATEMGADHVIDRSTTDFVEAVKEFTGGRGANVVFDPVGGDTYTRSTKCIAFEGRIVVVGFAGGTIQEAKLNHALVKNYSVLGLHLALYRTHAPEIIDEGFAALTALLDSGALVPRVGELVNFADAPSAMQRLADGRSAGRVTVLLPE